MMGASTPSLHNGAKRVDLAMERKVLQAIANFLLGDHKGRPFISVFSA